MGKQAFSFLGVITLICEAHLQRSCRGMILRICADFFIWRRIKVTDARLPKQIPFPPLVSQDLRP